MKPASGPPGTETNRRRPGPRHPWLARLYGPEAGEASLRLEILGGITTFLTLSYIVVVNPALLAEAGIPYEGALFATCLSAAVATLMMGLWARYPIALAPGMGLNAYFVYVAVPLLQERTGLPASEAWKAALGAVFLSGAVFLLLSAFRFRAAIVNAVPPALKQAVAAGIGLFIAFLGLQKAGLVRDHPVTLVTSGDLAAPAAWSAALGVLVSGILLGRRVRAAVPAGILTSLVLLALVGQVALPETLVDLPDPTTTFLALRPMAALEGGVLLILFAFLFVDLFDTVGTLLAVGEQGGFTDEDGNLPRAGRALQTDAVGTLLGGLLGTSTVTSYVESTAGIATGARTGVATLPVCLLFLVCIPFTPLLAVIPQAATAPALIVVGALMIRALGRIDWTDPTDGIPAFLTFAAIPLTFSISDGIAAGFLSWPLLKLASGKGRQVSWVVWLVFSLFLLRLLLAGFGLEL